MKRMPRSATSSEVLGEFPDLDVGLTGFDDGEITDLLSRVLEVDPGGGDDDDFDPEAALDTSRPAVTQKGELFELGQHRLLCGDCTEYWNSTPSKSPDDLRGAERNR